MKIVYFRIIHIYEINILSMNYDFFFTRSCRRQVGLEIEMKMCNISHTHKDKVILCCYCTQVNGLIFYKLLNSFRQSENLITL